MTTDKRNQKKEAGPVIKKGREEIIRVADEARVVIEAIQKRKEERELNELRTIQRQVSPA
ncbi:MAG: hypothetical protein P4M11_11345 [Candidatus Pacebacteria bacterium]|nr:hypothetical protein [Candidatus Paceibacterota bacterium]